MTKHTDLISLLKETHSWPGPYTFKFVVPKQQLLTLKQKAKAAELISEKQSRTGKYISVTLKKRFESPNQVLDYYNNVSDIDGLISL